MIIPTQRPLLEDTKHSQETDFHDRGGIRTRNLKNKRSQTHALDRAATGTGTKCQ